MGTDGEAAPGLGRRRPGGQQGLPLSPIALGTQGGGPCDLKFAWAPSVLYTLLTPPGAACGCGCNPGPPRLTPSPTRPPRLPAVCRDTVRVPS